MNDPATIEKTRVFSPMQVFAGSFLGGPAAAVYFLWRNFLSLEKGREARLTLLWGIVFNIAVLGSLPFLPQRFPNYVIPLAYCLAARVVVETLQFKKDAIASSSRFAFESGWRVAGIGVLFLVATVVVWITVLFPLAYFGIINLD